MRLVIRPASVRDALVIAPLVRPEDVEEWIALRAFAAFRSSGIAADLAYGVTHGEAWYGEEESGEPVALYGLCAYGGMAAPWLMATPAIARHGREALRRGRERLRVWQERGVPLINVVSARHTRAVRYVEACGYGILREFAAHGEHFFLFGANHV